MAAASPMPLPPPVTQTTFSASLGTPDPRLIAAGGRLSSRNAADERFQPAGPKTISGSHIVIGAFVPQSASRQRTMEIGRASCRERVEIAVGGGPLTE